MNLKKLNQARHARQRAEQRFNLIVNHAEMKVVVKDIQNGQAIFVDRQSCRVTRWVVRVKGVKVVAVYDSKRKSVATFLTLEMVARDMRKHGVTWAAGPEGKDNTLCS